MQVQPTSIRHAKNISVRMHVSSRRELQAVPGILAFPAALAACNACRTPGRHPTERQYLRKRCKQGQGCNPYLGKRCTEGQRLEFEVARGYSTTMIDVTVYQHFAADARQRRRGPRMPRLDLRPWCHNHLSANTLLRKTGSTF